MTDIAANPGTVRPIDVNSSEAQSRLRKRYAAEARFRFYGLAAVGLAGLFLVFLLSDIVRKGYPAFFESRLVLTVTPQLDQVSTNGQANAEGLQGGDYAAPLRDALQALFPDVTSRQDRRRLFFEVLSGGAASDLRRQVMANPSLVGQPVTFEALFDDAVDMYLKGYTTARDERRGRGPLTVSATTGEVTLSSAANDFAAALAVVKADLRRDAQALNAEADRVARGIALLPENDARRATAQQSVDTLRSRASALLARADATSAAEALDETTPSLLVSLNSGIVKVTSLAAGTASGRVLTTLSSANPAAEGAWTVLTLDQPESARRITDQQIAWVEKLRADGKVSQGFAWRFFTSGDSREPELAGLIGGMVGSALTMLVTLILCLPIGVGAAIYLEEFAPKNRITDIIEVNINNLAAVPSIVFGLLGLAMFLNFFGLPRSAPLVGGLVLALLVLPTIIIASRAALKAVPPSIREAALGVGASHQQAVFHHVLPLAMPGILTGTIIGMAHALGETAPLLLIGMVAFIVDVPQSINQAATVLPVQIYLWSDLPEPAFQAKTAGAIIVLLGFLFIMNGLAIVLRKRFERRW